MRRARARLTRIRADDIGAAPYAAPMADMDGMDGDDARTDAIKLVLKLAFFVYILGQDGGNQRLVLLSIGAVIIFLAQMGHLNFLNQLTAPRPPPPQAQGVQAARTFADGRNGPAARIDGDGGARDAAAANAAPAAVVAEPEGAVTSLLRDIESIVGAFFSSLLPSWRAHDGAADEPQLQAAAEGNANM